MAVKVKLLQKKISGGRETLYLDFYPAIISLKTGKETRREFLGLYIHEKPKNAIEKQYNAEQLKLAEAIRQQKENTHNKPEIYNEYEKERLRKKELATAISSNISAGRQANVPAPTTTTGCPH